VPAIYVRQLGDCVLCAAWRHRQSTLRHTGMSLRARLLITLCNWLLPGDAAQVAAVRFGFGNLCVCQLRRAERVVLYRSLMTNPASTGSAYSAIRNSATRRFHHAQRLRLVSGYRAISAQLLGCDRFGVHPQGAQKGPI
jgi:hypothetical protein